MFPQIQDLLELVHTPRPVPCRSNCDRLQSSHPTPVCQRFCRTHDPIKFVTIEKLEAKFELPYAPNMAMLAHALKLVEQLGHFLQVETIMVPDDILALSVDLLAGSKDRERSCDFESPW